MKEQSPLGTYFVSSSLFLFTCDRHAGVFLQFKNGVVIMVTCMVVTTQNSKVVTCTVNLRQFKFHLLYTLDKSFQVNETASQGCNPNSRVLTVLLYYLYIGRVLTGLNCYHVNSKPILMLLQPVHNLFKVATTLSQTC